ncbi:MAG: family 1 glycosylhydrolase [Candidatus Devosia symbiotica]|nr:family 1 glycosylhydrolase [Candidatus Devosia symbiotica]
MATPGNVHNGDIGAVACNHYELWPQDLDLIRDAGFDAYRFSFSWPRLIPLSYRAFQGLLHNTR